MTAATSETLYSVHYSLFDSLEASLGPEPRCIEYVVYNLKPSIKFDNFYRVWSENLKVFEACPVCCPILLGQQIEDPTGVVQIQPWMTLEDHIDGFKGRQDLDEIMAPLAKTVANYVANGWSGTKAYHLLLDAQGKRCNTEGLRGSGAQAAAC